MKNNKSVLQLNKGFTLVELIVSIAILAIVGVAIAAFFSVAMRQYKTNTNEVNIQTESQMAWKRLESNILITTNGIWSPSPNQIDLYNYNPDGTYKYTKTSIYYDDSDDKNSIYYQEYYLGDGNNWVENGERQVFANLVTSCEFELFDKDGNKITDELDDKGKPKYKGKKLAKVTAHITYDANGREYDASNSVALRNSVVASDVIDDIYDK